MNDLKDLRAYYQLDPTLIHATELWRNATKINTDDYLAELTTLQDNLSKGKIQADKIHALAADPLLKAATSEKPKLLQLYQALKLQFINTRSQSLYNISRRLFVAIPNSDFVNPNTAQCPHTKAVIDYYNQLNYFVQHDIKSQTSINARISAFASWLSVINKLQNQGDYSSFSAIGQALCVGLTRLYSVKNGLSVRQLDQLENIKHVISNPSVMKHMLGSHHQAVMPDPSIYRHSIGLYSVDDQQNHTEKLTELQTRLIKYQQALVSNDQSTDIPCEITEWTKASKNRTKISVSQQEKDNPSKSSANLYHRNSTCLVAQLADPQLRQIIIKSRLIIDEMVTDHDIDQMNRALKRNVSTKKYARRLSNLGIQLSVENIERINRHDPQLYYRHLINNPALQLALQKTHIHYNKSGGSTANAIQRLNTQCRAGMSAKQLSDHLTTFGVSLDTRQLQSVVSDINRRRHLTPTPTIERLLDRANRLLKKPLLKHIKNQMNDYMQLLRYETDPQILQQHLGDALSQHGMRNASPNPYLHTLDELTAIINQLSELRTQLGSDDYDTTLNKRIKQLRKTIHKPFYQQLFDRHQLMQDALGDLKSTGSLSEDCQQRATELTSTHWSVSLGLRQSSSHLNNRILRLHQRAIGEAKRQAYSDFDQMQNALTVTWQRLCYFSRQLDSTPPLNYELLLQQANHTTDEAYLQQIEQQLHQQTRLLQLQQAWLDYTTLVSSNSAQYQTVYDLQKKYPSIASSIDQQHKALWTHCGTLHGQHKKNTEGLSQLLAGRSSNRLSNIKQQVSLQAFNQLSSHAKLTKRVADVRKQLHIKSNSTTQAKVQPSKIDTTAPTTCHQPNHWQQYAIWGATGVGALLLGAAGMHYAPHLVARFASLGALSVIGIKTAVTASSAAVGGAAGHWFEKNLLNRFGLFASKPESISLDQHSTEEPQITMGR
ncbi:MAG: RasGEF domain-containing protein [Coxiellaceae bacterium]|nr:RasGEF domain-containing protein [Coxiellaceae bacterium]